jgi:LacI family transcriptional regulator
MSLQPNGKRVTLATVAARAGVSVTTVSSILSGRDKFMKIYRSETIAKVRQTAERLGYRANLFATGLPMKRPPFFALVLQDLHREALGSWHQRGYEGSLLAGAMWAAMERRLYPVTAATLKEPDRAAVQEIARLIDGGVFGTIVRTPGSHFGQFLAQRYDAGHPLVVVFPRKAGSWKTNAIDVDNAAVGRMAAHLLAQRRRKRWALVRYDKVRDAVGLRCEHFLSMAREAGATLDTIRLSVEMNEMQARDLIARRCEQSKPDGLFAPEAVPAVGSLLACIKLGTKPTEDFDLVGCDCASWYSMYLPTITCVDVSWEEVGMRAVQELANMYEHNENRFHSILLEPRVVEGGTCPLPTTLQSASL